MKNWDNLHANVDILKTVLDAYHYFDLKSNLTGSTVRNAGETSDINRRFSICSHVDPRLGSQMGRRKTIYESCDSFDHCVECLA